MKDNQGQTRVLVTGGAGFIGSHLVQGILSSSDKSVTVLDDLSTGREENIREFGDRVHFVRGCVTDAAACQAAMRNVGEVFHLASRVSVVESVENPGLYRDVVLGGTENILSAGRARGIRRVVLASSCSVYGPAAPPVTESASIDPESPYAAFKFQAEEACRASDLQTVCPRFFNVYGARQRSDSPYSGVIAIFADLARKKIQPRIFGDGLQTRDFVHVSDIVGGLISCMERESVGKGDPVNLGTGKATTIIELANLLGCVEPVFESARSGEIRHSRADIAKAKRVLEFAPKVGLVEGLRDVVGAAT